MLPGHVLRAKNPGDDMAEPLKATFFAFKKREQSGVVLRATLAFVIVAVAIVGAFAALFWSSVGPVVSWYGEVLQAASTNDTAAMQNMSMPPAFFSVIGGMLLFMFPFYILCAAYEAACLRWFIHGETKGFMGLSLGAPTWRVWSCYWMWLLLNMGFSIVMSLFMGVAIGIIAVGSSGDPAATLTVMPVVYVVQYGLMAYFGTRFAPAAATTIARRRFAFFDAWKVTKGRFLPLFGSFFLLYLIYFLASIALAAVWFIAVLGPSAPDLSAAAQNPAQFEQVFVQIFQAYIASFSNPQTWAVLGALQLVGVVIGVVFYVAMYGVNARAAQAAIEDGKITPEAA